MTSQTASNVSALVSLQNALQDNLETVLTGNGLTGNGLVGTSLANSLTTSLPVNNMSGDMSGSNGSTVMSGSLAGTYTSQASAGLIPGSTTVGSIPASSVSQNALLQQRAKPQRTKLPPPSKVLDNHS